MRLIDADALIQDMNDQGIPFNADVNQAILNARTIERPKGKWIPYEYGDETWHQCTACGVADKYIDYVKGYDGKTGKLVSVRNYCPNCGARMDGDEQ